MDDKAKIALEITLELIKNKWLSFKHQSSNEEVGNQAATLFNAVLKNLTVE
jgi:hypothetical protein